MRLFARFVIWDGTLILSLPIAELFVSTNASLVITQSIIPCLVKLVNQGVNVAKIQLVTSASSVKKERSFKLLLEYPRVLTLVLMVNTRTQKMSAKIV